MTALVGNAASSDVRAASSSFPAGTKWFLLGLIVLGAAACIGVVVWQLLYNGPFRWHVALPQFWQGGIEALVLIAVLGSLQLWRHGGGRLILSLLLGELYLRRHAVDVAVLVDLLYFEIVLVLGAAVTRLCGGKTPDDIPGYLRSFLLGFCAWSVCAWGISALGHGSLRDLRVLTFVLVIPALVARSRPWCVFVVRRAGALPSASRVAVGMLAAWFLIQFAHSAIAFGYDSQWYGLRGDRVLVGAGSVFASQGLVSPVNYFPKVYELFLIPVSGLGNSSVIAGVTICLLGLLAAAAYAALRELGVRDALARLSGVGLAVTVPAVANSALDPKPDLLAAFLLLFAWINAIGFVRTRSPTHLLWMLSPLVLAPQAKLTAIPFVAALILGSAIAVWRNKPTLPADSDPADRRTALIGFLLVVAVSLFATARTWLLTGMPTIGPDPLFKLWLALGFNLRFPAGTLVWNVPTDWAGIPALAVDLLFRPQLLEHIIISWTGNVWLWLALVALAAGLMQRRSARGAIDGPAFTPGFGLAIAAPVLMLCWGFSVRGGDGNYFIAGILPAILLGSAAAWRALSQDRGLRRAWLLAVFAISLFQAGYSLLSASWNPGTRPFDFDLSLRTHRFRDQTKNAFAENGLARIAEHLHGLHHAARVIGCTQFADTLGMRLPASYEWVAQIGFSRPEFTDTKEHFLGFLKADRIEYLVVPTPQNPHFNCRSLQGLTEAVEWLDKDPQITTLRDDGYVLYDLSALR